MSSYFAGVVGTTTRTKIQLQYEVHFVQFDTTRTKIQLQYEVHFVQFEQHGLEDVTSTLRTQILLNMKLEGRDLEAISCVDHDSN
jgi:hypothetical protein